MIELRNRQYATIIDCVAGEALEQGQVIQLVYHAGRDFVTAMKATAAGHVSPVLGPLFAYWINERSTSVAFRGGEDGFTFTVTPSTDLDTHHYIASGKRMLAVGGPGVTEIRFFDESIDSGQTLANITAGTLLRFTSDESKLCLTADGAAVAKDVAFVIENDGVSLACLIGSGF